MIDVVDVAEVHALGRRVGAVAWDPERELGTFEYAPDWIDSGLQLAPLHMPLPRPASRRRFRFPALDRATFRGLPGLLADSLPDRFGDALIDAWLAREGRARSTFSPVERLCYVGTRGMGALEFRPALAKPAEANPLVVERLVALASQVLRSRAGVAIEASEGDADDEGMRQLLAVGTSAGGARAKAVVAWNPETGKFRSGQVDAPGGFEPWIVKFDGVAENRDRELADPQGYGRIEYAYHLMARAAGIEMAECRLFEEGGRAHFMTRRFDRTTDGSRLHLQSLCALDHLDFNLAGAHGYEQAFAVLRALNLGVDSATELLRRVAFNVAARNQDDHTKNIAFLMNAWGQWRLSPAFDVTYAYNPQGAWTSRHQMTVAGKREGIVRADLEALGRRFGIKRPAPILDEVMEAVGRWPEFAESGGIDGDTCERIAETHVAL